MAKRVRDFAADLEAREQTFTDVETGKVKAALIEAAAAQLAANTAQGPKVDTNDLPGTYGDVWRRLWEIAREFATTEAYKGKEYPGTDSDARCVLCQQILDEDAKSRFARFDEYVRDETRARARQAAEAVASLITKFGLHEPLRTKYDTLSADVAAAAKDKAAIVEAYIAALDTRLEHVQRCLKERAWTEPAALPGHKL